MQVKDVVSDRLLVQLLSTWLSPASQPPRIKPRCPSAAQATPSFSPSKCCKAQLGVAVLCADDCAQQQMQASNKQPPAIASGSRPPLQEITYIHAAIRSALESFAVEAHSMQGGAQITANRLKALVEKHRFLRSVCTFHSASEDEVLLPAARYVLALVKNLRKSGNGILATAAVESACWHLHCLACSLCPQLGVHLLICWLAPGLFCLSVCLFIHAFTPWLPLCQVRAVWNSLSEMLMQLESANICDIRHLHTASSMVHLHGVPKYLREIQQHT